ncbi:MAG: response regulator transcription factor [Thermoleophilia bacterium]
MRVVICEDHALLREGLVALLRENGVEVVGVAEDADRMLRLVERVEPDVLICDVRLPPGFSDEGIRAAILARQRHPGLAILMLSQYVEPAYTAELLATGEGGVGYLLKERVGDVSAFMESLERVASGGTALDREVIATVMQQRRASDSILARLSDREREVLALMAEGRTNAAIARELVVTVGAVEKHITGMFGKLGLAATDDDHRRVLAVLTFLRESGAA